MVKYTSTIEFEEHVTLSSFDYVKSDHHIDVHAQTDRRNNARQSYPDMLICLSQPTSK